MPLTRKSPTLLRNCALVRQYLRQRSLSDLARGVGVTRDRVSQIVQKEFRRMYKPDLIEQRLGKQALPEAPRTDVIQKPLEYADFWFKVLAIHEEDWGICSKYVDIPSIEAGAQVVTKPKHFENLQALHRRRLMWTRQYLQGSSWQSIADKTDLHSYTVKKGIERTLSMLLRRRALQSQGKPIEVPQQFTPDSTYSVSIWQIDRNRQQFLPVLAELEAEA